MANISKRQVQRLASKLRSRSSGCKCSSQGYLNAINDFQDMLDKKIDAADSLSLAKKLTGINGGVDE